MTLSRIKALHKMQAVRMFTDREMALSSFYRVFDDYMAGNTPLKILMYYGVGGIGKTRLLKHLKNELEQIIKKERQPLMLVDINLESAQFDSPAVCLYAIYNQLEMSCPAFEYALARLWSLQGWSVQDVKRQVINKDSLLFDLVELAVDASGFFAPVRLFFRLLEEGSQYASRCWGDSKLIIQEIDGLSEEELEERLPYYLGIAVEGAAVSQQKSFIFLMDSHEKIQQRDTFQTNRRSGDEWLQELIGASENGLYIIAGREYLKWADNNPAWSDYLEQHILGALSDKDADYFLSAFPIQDEKIRQVIIETAHGVPLYLDLCASIYMMRKLAGETVTRDDFRLAEKDVIRCFISHLDRAQAETLKACALVERFDSDFFLALTKGLNIHFPITQFHEFCTTSYTIQIDINNETYKIHDTVRGFISEEVELDIVERLINIILEHCTRFYSVENAARISWVYQQAYILLTKYPLSLQQAQTEQLVDIGLRLLDAGYWRRISLDIDHLIERTGDRQWPAGIYFLQAFSLRKEGKLNQACAIYDGLLKRADELGVWMPIVRFHAAHTKHLIGRYQEAFSVYKTITQIQGQDPRIIQARQLAYRQLADLQMLRGEFVDALKSFISLTSIENDALWLAELHRFRGHVNRFNLNFAAAEDHYQKALKLSEQVHAEAMQGKALTNIAETLCWTAPHSAISISDKAIKINQQVNAPIEVGKALTAQAIALAAIKGRPEEALVIACQAINLQKHNGYRSGILFALQARGLAEFLLKRRDTAYATLKEMQQLSVDIGGVYAYISIVLSLLLNAEVLDSFVNRFQWLNFSRTEQSVKFISNHFLDLAK